MNIKTPISTTAVAVMVDANWFRIPAMFLVVLLVPLVLVTAVENTNYCMLQEQLFLHINSILNRYPPGLWENITLLGDANLLVPLIALFLLRDARGWLALIIASVLTGVLSSACKYGLQMPRPGSVLDPDQFILIGKLLTKHSLPSGHTMTVFAGVITLLIHRCPRPRMSNDWIPIFIAVCFAVLVGASRVAVGAHWPFDVYFGAMLGWIAAWVGVVLSRSVSEQWLESFEKRHGHLIPILLLILCLILVSRILQGTETAPLFYLTLFAGLGAAAAIFYQQLGNEPLLPDANRMQIKPQRVSTPGFGKFTR